MLLDEGFESRVLPCSLPLAGSWHRRRDIFQLLQKSVFSPSLAFIYGSSLAGGGARVGKGRWLRSLCLGRGPKHWAEAASCRGASWPRCSQGMGTSRPCSQIPNPASSRSKRQAKAFLKASTWDGPINPRPAFHLPLIPGQH